MSKNGVREGGIWMAGCCAGAGVGAGMMACSCDGKMAGCWVGGGVGAGMVVCSSDGVEVMMAGCLVVMAGWEGASSWECGAGGGGGGGGASNS